ncbi:MAG: chromosome segregation ATPase [Cyanobacteriota bacterium]|nr:chromosome segregation ATPase [Cyanobacteriota bacterium]
MKDRDKRNRSAVGASTPSSKQSKDRLYAGKTLKASSPELGSANRAEPTHSSALPSSAAEVETLAPPSSRLPRWLFVWVLTWQFWAIAVLGLTGTAGFIATSALFKLPTLPSCPTLFLPLASASMRLYCAQLSADKQTTYGLLKAIELVEDLPPEHPLREEINRNIEQWSVQILDLTDEKFQNGDLEEAIADARRIPKYVEAYKLVKERIAKWQSVWDKADKIIAESEKLMLDAKWALAFRKASELTSLGNRYWTTTRYPQLIETIRVAQEESGKLDKAFALLKRGGVDNLLEAIEIAEEIKPDSTARKEAQKLVVEAGDKLLELAMARLEAGDWSTVMEIANRVPARLDIQEEITDLNNLAEAGSQAGVGTISGLEAAIEAAKAVPPGRPLYAKAQRLVGRWQLEIQDVQTLTKAEELASSGGTNYLRAAIAQARLVPRSHPRHRAAQGKIAEWTRQIQAIEDRPTIERADRYASSGNTEDIRQAINETRSIDSSRPLYQEAQERSRRWQEEIDNSSRPVVENAGDLVVEEAAPSRSASPPSNRPTARTIDRSELQDRSDLNRAIQIASQRTPSALSEAIRIAQQVPSDSVLRNQSVQRANSWSEDLLRLARERANSNVSEAIEIGRMVPGGTSAYPSARSQIEVWQQSLQPDLAPSPPPLQPPSPDEDNLIPN